MNERRAELDREDPAEELVLAAASRAVRHRLPGPGPAPLWLLREHLAIRSRSREARVLRRRVEELERRGLLRREAPHGVPSWSPTAAGEERLARAGAQPLPLSPRHREWRRARLAAAQELPRFRSALAAALAEAEEMLAAEAPSGAWVELGSRLAGDCRRFGSAWHCLYEWPEPDDDAPTPPPQETARLAALRNVRLWREGL